MSIEIFAVVLAGLFALCGIVYQLSRLATALEERYSLPFARGNDRNWP